VLFRSVARLTPSGVLSPAQKVAGVGPNPIFASDGKDGYLAVWTGISEIDCLRLGADFQPLDAAPIVIKATNANPAVAWDGKQYVLAWSGEAGVAVARIAAQPIIQTIGSGHTDSIDLVPVPSGTAILWTESASERLAFLRQDGTTTAVTTLADEPVERRLVALPNGDVGFLEVSAESRITISIGTAVPLPPVPEAPKVTVTLHDGVVDLVWTAPPQPVTGYRVEYNPIDTGWLEITPQLAAEERSISRPLRYPTVKYAFRVRAWNDAGPGAYSDVIVVNGGRRRAR